MPICTKCLKQKDKKSFSFRFKTKQKRHTVCTVCVAKYRKQYYEKNKHNQKSSDHRLKMVLRNKEKRKRNKNFILSVLLKSKCTDCKENNPLVLEFDHRDPKKKNYDISLMVQWMCSIENIRKEIAKCDVRCANCHRIRTRKQFGWKQ